MMLGRILLHSRKLAYGVRTYGPRYLLHAPANELRNPRLAITLHLRRAVTSVADRLRPRSGGDTLPDDCLIFAFDLDAAPITFDIATFLAGAELERRRLGLAALYVLFIPGRHDGLRQELPGYETAITTARRHWRVRNILIPTLALLPSVRGYTVCATREQAEALLVPGHPVVPEDYRVWLSRQPDKRLVHVRAADGPVWPLLRASDQARALVAGFLASACGGRRPLVITLRESTAYPARNSRQEEWRAFLDTVDRTRFAPIVVHDTERTPAPGPFDGELSYDPARWHVDLRMALYEAAWLNLAVMQGPMELCWYNERARYVVFVDLSADPSCSAELITEGGVNVGQDLPFATPFQHIVWHADRAPLIREAFDQMSARIEG